MNAVNGNKVMYLLKETPVQEMFNTFQTTQREVCSKRQNFNQYVNYSAQFMRILDCKLMTEKNNNKKT